MTGGQFTVIKFNDSFSLGVASNQNNAIFVAIKLFIHVKLHYVHLPKPLNPQKSTLKSIPALANFSFIIFLVSSDWPSSSPISNLITFHPNPLNNLSLHLALPLRLTRIAPFRPFLQSLTGSTIVSSSDVKRKATFIPVV